MDCSERRLIYGRVVASASFRDLRSARPVFICNASMMGSHLSDRIDKSTPAASFEWLVSQARTDADALGRLFDDFRPTLLLKARRQINSKLGRRCDPVDAVQQALTLAVDRFDQFRGTTPYELHTWLCAIQENVIRDVIRRHVTADRRSVDREVALDAQDQAAPESPMALATDSTPSRHFVRCESNDRLAALVDDLPEGQREAMRLHYFEGKKIWEVAESMQISMTAVAGLVKRALRTLRTRMNESSWR